MREGTDLAPIVSRFSRPDWLGMRKVPKYLLLSNAVLEAIETGEYRSGTKIPSERNLIAALPVSLGTVQKALNELVEQGVITRRPGKGSFVAGAESLGDVQNVPETDLWNFRFRSAERGPLLPVSITVVATDRIERDGGDAKSPWGRFLNVDGTFIRIDRILDVSGQFRGFSRFYLPYGLYKALLKYPYEDLSGTSLRVLLEKEYNLPTLSFEHHTRSQVLPDKACDLLGLARGSVGTGWELLGRSYRQTPASYQCVFLPPGHAPIEVEEKRR